jgi:hypothetical protein
MKILKIVLALVILALVAGGVWVWMTRSRAVPVTFAKPGIRRNRSIKSTGG